MLRKDHKRDFLENCEIEECLLKMGLNKDKQYGLNEEDVKEEWPKYTNNYTKIS